MSGWSRRTGSPHNYTAVCHEDVKIWASVPVITNIGYEVNHPAGLVTNPTTEHPTRARTRGASGEFTIRRLPSGEATGGLAVTPRDEVWARSLWVYFPTQPGTAGWLEAEQQQLTVDGDIDLGDVELVLRGAA